MPYALVPDGYKLEKVTKAQQEAVDKFASTNATAAFLSGPASGELVKAVAIVVTPIVLAALAKQIDLPDFNITEFLDKQLEKIPGLDLSALGEFSP
mgnify:CR=1 FL=1